MLKFFNHKKYNKGEMIQGYRILDVIGEGRYGICYSVEKDNNIHILKSIKPKFLRRNKDKLFYEKEILLSLNNENIPKIIDEINISNEYGYIMEYKEGCTLEELLFGYRCVFSREDIYNIGIKMIEIIKYLHKRNIVHRDIRLPNIIINKDQVFLIDFGLSRWIDDDRYKPDVDFSFLGDVLIHLYYSSYTKNSRVTKPWYEELELSKDELYFLKRLLRLEKNYDNIEEVERDFIKCMSIDSVI